MNSGRLQVSFDNEPIVHCGTLVTGYTQCSGCTALVEMRGVCGGIPLAGSLLGSQSAPIPEMELYDASETPSRIV